MNNCFFSVRCWTNAHISLWSKDNAANTVEAISMHQISTTLHMFGVSAAIWKQRRAHWCSAVRHSDATRVYDRHLTAQLCKVTRSRSSLNQPYIASKAYSVPLHNSTTYDRELSISGQESNDCAIGQISRQIIGNRNVASLLQF